MKILFVPILFAISGLLQPCRTLADQEATMQVHFDERLGPMNIHKMALGQGGLSADPIWDSRIQEVKALRPGMIRLFIHEYFHLMPERGKYRFDVLDRSVETIVKTGARPLMCICFKPKVLFPAIDQDIVEPNDYAEWERLIAALVKHYKSKGWTGLYWEVANEPDIGEDGGCPYRFKPDNYARYYRHTVEAILHADPTAKVGGPALAYVKSPILPALLLACEKEKLPLHFISWHIYSSEPAQIRSTIDYAKELLAKHPSLHPETILDEWNMDLMNPRLDPRFQPCYVLETIRQMKEGGLDWSCYYQIRERHVDYNEFAPFMSPKGTAFMTRWWNRMPQFDGVFDYQNTIRPAYFAFKLLSRFTGEQLRIVGSHPAVHAIATHDEKYAIDSLLVWNFSQDPVELEMELTDLPGEKLMRHITFDALAPSNDENARLRPDPSLRLSAGNHHLKVQLEPYGIQYWSFE